MGVEEEGGEYCGDDEEEGGAEEGGGAIPEKHHGGDVLGDGGCCVDQAQCKECDVEFDVLFVIFLGICCFRCVSSNWWK